MNADLKTSYQLCQRIARQRAGNFYYAFLPLNRERRQAMCALYAFLRKTDDLGDSPSTADERRQALSVWRQQLEQALQGQFVDPRLPALADTVRQFEIPREYLEAVLDGVEMDLTIHRYQTFGDLSEYCHRVASAVGLCCLHIWGHPGEDAIQPAEQVGVAFQLTNILRDLEEDLEAGRVYLPLEDLERFGYGVEDLAQGTRDDRFHALMQFQMERAENYYAAGPRLYDMLSPGGQMAFSVMYRIYHGLLQEIRRRDGDVFSRRVRLSGLKKLRIAASSMLLRPRLVGGK